MELADIMTLEQLEEIARAMTQAKLADYEVPEEVRRTVALTTLFEGDDRIFVLYVPGETRDQPQIIARTRLDARTGVGAVEVVGLVPKMGV